MIAGQFLDVFWPELSATFLGAAVGVPLGLWVDRRRRAKEVESSERAAQTQIEGARDVARGSVAHNVEELRDLKSSLSENRAPLDTGLSSGAWTAVRAAVLLGLRDDPCLRGELGGFFDQLESVVELNSLLLEQAVGVSSALSTAAGLRSDLRSHELKRVELLLVKGTGILERLPADPRTGGEGTLGT